MRRLLAVAVLLGPALLACGSSSTPRTPPPVPGGAMARTPSSAPSYCKDLAASVPLIEVGSAMNELAANPSSASAKAAIRQAGGVLRDVAKRTPRSQRVVLASAAFAVAGLAERGLVHAARAERALVRAGHLLEHSCRFPLG